MTRHIKRVKNWDRTPKAISNRKYKREAKQEIHFHVCSVLNVELLFVSVCDRVRRVILSVALRIYRGSSPEQEGQL